MKAALLAAGGEEIHVSESENLASALEMAQSGKGKTLVAGSLFLIGETLSLLNGDAFEVSLQ